MKHNSLKANLSRQLKAIEQRKEMASLCDQFDSMDMQEGAQAVVNMLKKEFIKESETFTAEYLTQGLIKKLNSLQGRECFF